MATSVTDPQPSSSHDRLRFPLRWLLITLTTVALAVGAVTALVRHDLRATEELDALHSVSAVAMLFHDAARQIEYYAARNLRDHDRVEAICKESLYSWRLVVTGWTALYSSEDILPELESRWDSGSYDNVDYDHRLYRLARSDDGIVAPRILAIVGPDTAFDVIWRNALHEVRSPPDDAILFVDVGDSALHWMEPGDISADDLDASKPRGGLPPRFLPIGRILGFADGEVWLIDHSAPPEAILKFATIGSAEEHSRDDELGPYMLRRIPSRIELH